MYCRTFIRVKKKVKPITEEVMVAVNHRGVPLGNGSFSAKAHNILLTGFVASGSPRRRAPETAQAEIKLLVEVGHVPLRIEFLDPGELYH